ncbi:hypothetical protein FQN60_004777 [Etheostoma spectabile]|uniref:Thiamine transporter 1 n=1 Tax=Etheostoma spectabile TaxID=54343 RepID=A0A5J5DL20_9PERO|nr:hypothetical protein FQN60_004777 [Etheostoma spectabile]
MGSWAKLKSSSWGYPTAVLSLYGFFAYCRVAEPFLTPYLIGPHKNISGEVVTNYLFPIWTYSYLAFLFPVFLLTDFLKHKPLIVVQGLFLVTNYVLLCFAPGLTAMIFLQVNYAVVTSTEVAYFSYIYSVIPVENYQKATGYLRSAMLTGYTFGASLGQVLVSLAGVDYFYINAITLGIVSMAFLVSFWLPMPQKSLFFKGIKAAAVGSQSQQEGPLGVDVHEEPVVAKDEAGSGREKMERNGRAGWCSWENVASAGHLLWQSFREDLIYWSVWWALATAGYVQVFNYIQLMWDHIEPSATSSIYNGGVEAVCSLVGAAAAFSVGHIKLTWAVWGELALGLFSAVATGAVFLMALTSSIWACYAAYFIIYGSYYAVISMLFLIRGTYTACKNQRNPEHTETKELESSVWFLELGKTDVIACRGTQKPELGRRTAEDGGREEVDTRQSMKAVRRWRADWRYPTTLLCIYGFFSTVKPLEPFLIPYLTGPEKNLTTEQVNNQIFPVWTYSYLSVLVPVFLLTDWLRYKPVVVFQSVTLFITTAMLLWLKSVPAMQAMQFFYGVVTASEVAYFSYIYSVVDQTRYRKATSYCRSVQLLGYTVGSVLGQLLISFSLMSYNNILVLTLVLTAIALLVSCLLPMPRQSMFFHRRPTGQKIRTEGAKRHDNGTWDATEHTSIAKESLKEMRDEKAEEAETEDKAGMGLDEKGSKTEESVGSESCSQVLILLWRDFLQCYSSRQLLYWSVWWAMATCGYNQTVNYVQVLWEHVQPSQNLSIYNGGVEAVSNLLSAATAYGIGFTEVRWEQWGELALGGFSGLGAAALFLMTFVCNIWVCYAGYVVFKCLYMLLITIAIYFSLIAVVFSLRGLFIIWRAQRNKKESITSVKNESPELDEHRF